MRRNISVSLDEQTLESIEKWRQLTTVSRFIESCVLEYLNKRKTRPHPKGSDPKSPLTRRIHS